MKSRTLRHLSLLPQGILGTTVCAGYLVSMAPVLSWAGKENQGKEEKTVTLISASSSVDGGTEIARETVKDCIAALPDPQGLEPEVTTETLFLHEVNGEANKNEWVRVYRAKLEIHFLQTKQEMLIVTTRSLHGQAPVFKELDKSLSQSQTFVSDAGSGDLFAGRSKRQYYFSKPEAAIKDVRDRAKAWIAQRQSVICPDGGGTKSNLSK